MYCPTTSKQKKTGGSNRRPHGSGGEANEGDSSADDNTFSMRSVQDLHEAFLHSRGIYPQPCHAQGLVLQMVHGLTTLGVAGAELHRQPYATNTVVSSRSSSPGGSAAATVVPRRTFRKFEKGRVGRIIADVLLDAAALCAACGLDLTDDDEIFKPLMLPCTRDAAVDESTLPDQPPLTTDLPLVVEGRRGSLGSVKAGELAAAAGPGSSPHGGSGATTVTTAGGGGGGGRLPKNGSHDSTDSSSVTRQHGTQRRGSGGATSHSLMRTDDDSQAASPFCEIKHVESSANISPHLKPGGSGGGLAAVAAANTALDWSDGGAGSSLTGPPNRRDIADIPRVATPAMSAASASTTSLQSGRGDGGALASAVAIRSGGGGASGSPLPAAATGGDQSAQQGPLLPPQPRTATQQQQQLWPGPLAAAARRRELEEFQDALGLLTADLFASEEEFDSLALSWFIPIQPQPQPQAVSGDSFGRTASIGGAAGGAGPPGGQSPGSGDSDGVELAPDGRHRRVRLAELTEFQNAVRAKIQSLFGAAPS